MGYTEFDLKWMFVKRILIWLLQSLFWKPLNNRDICRKNFYLLQIKRFKLQEVPQIDVIQAEIALNQMITQVNTAKTNVKNALSDFNKIINDPKNITYDSRDNIFAEENNFF